MGGKQSDGHIWFFVDVFLSFAETVCWSCGPMPEPLNHIWWRKESVQSQIWKRWAITSVNMKCKTQKCQQIFCMSAAFFLDVNLLKRTFNTGRPGNCTIWPTQYPSRYLAPRRFKRSCKKWQRRGRWEDSCLAQRFQVESGKWRFQPWFYDGWNHHLYRVMGTCELFGWF